MVKVIQLAAITLALSGCVSPGTFCSIAQPHLFTPQTQAVMTDEEVKQELKHNETGAKLCGWKPSGD